MVAFSFITSVHAIRLHNDAPFELIAVVEAANGTFLGQAVLQPGEEKDITEQELELPASPSGSMTPYTVIWECPYGGYYSTCMEVPSGGTVIASKCPGAHYCQPKKKKADKQEEQTSCSTCPNADRAKNS